MAQQTSKLADRQGMTSPGWSVQGVGKRWQLRFFHVLLRLGGRRPAYHIMYFVVLWYVIFVPAIRRRTRHYLRRRFPHVRSRLRRFWQSYRLVCTFGRSMIDRAALALLGPKALHAVCPDSEAIRDITADSDGAVLVNAHVGCWQVAMTTLGHLTRDVSLVMIPPEGLDPQALLKEAGQPYKVIDPRKGLESILEMMQALGRGEILGLMGDRVFGSAEGRTYATFVGDRIELPLSPYRLAGATGKPILVLFSHKVGFSRYQVRLARVIRVSEQASTPEACMPYAQEFADALEAFVREQPWQFFNFYDIWGDRPDGEVAEADGLGEE